MQRAGAGAIRRVTPLKLIFDVDAVRPPLTGVGRYAWELAQGYAARLPSNRLKLYAAGRWVRDLERRLQGSMAGPALRRRVAALRLAGSAYRRALPLVARMRLRGFEDHVFHGPAYVVPPFAGVSVATIHDLSTYLYPEYHPPERVRHVNRGIENALRHAQFLITDSEHVRRDLIDRFAWSPTQVATIPLGASGHYRPGQRRQAHAYLASLNLEVDAFVLYIGTIEPRKNLEVLLDAYDGLAPTLRRRFPLVFAGYEGWHSEAVHARIARAASEGWARYLGYVDEAMMPALTAAARLFVYPSRYEGFGLPVIEAMASGVPVIAANTSSLPEVTQGAARLLDPDDVAGWRGAIAELLENAHQRMQMREAGLRQATGFTWDRTVDQTLACLQHVATSRGARA
ncbi:glycosyltransferase family 1 protein [Niveibacterium umoris]